MLGKPAASTTPNRARPSPTRVLTLRCQHRRRFVEKKQAPAFADNVRPAPPKCSTASALHWPRGNSELAWFPPPRALSRSAPTSSRWCSASSSMVRASMPPPMHLRRNPPLADEATAVVRAAENLDAMGDRTEARAALGNIARPTPRTSSAFVLGTSSAPTSNMPPPPRPTPGPSTSRRDRRATGASLCPRHRLRTQQGVAKAEADFKARLELRPDQPQV